MKLTSLFFYRCAAALFIAAFFTFAAQAQTTVFPYQGMLPNSVTPATGAFEMEFKLFDAATGGVQIGQTLNFANVEVKNRAFGVLLDFGAEPFSGADRFIEVSVRRQNSGEPFAVPYARQQILSPPYSIRSLNSSVADAAVNLVTTSGNINANDFVQTGDTRLSNPRDPNPGSTYYIQNSTQQQGLANFNIDGNGTLGGTLSANVVNAETQFNIGGKRVLSVNYLNTFGGVDAGKNTTGVANVFFGDSAGRENINGFSNSFFGSRSGMLNTNGGDNSFFGDGAGVNNTSGANNAFFGKSAGLLNQTGSNNSALGYRATVSTGNLRFATAIGSHAVVNASDTIVIGKAAGGYESQFRPADTVIIPGNLNVEGTITGNFNFPVSNFTGVLGAASGGTGLNSPGAGGNFLRSNGTSWTSSALEASDIPAGSLNYIQNTTSIQFGSNFHIEGTGTAGIFSARLQYNINDIRVLSVSGSGNTFVGRGAGASSSLTGEFNTFVGDGAGFSITFGKHNSFFGSGSGSGNMSGYGNSFFGSFAGRVNADGDSNSFFGFSAGEANLRGSYNTFFGNIAGRTNTHGNYNTIIGANADVNSADLSYATAIGAGAVVRNSNTIVLGRDVDTVEIPGIKFKLSAVAISMPGSTPLCYSGGGVVSGCASSLRFKTDITSFNFGLNLVNRLQPITFRWKDGGMLDLGLGAEEVEKIEPLLVTYNAEGQVQGVKYDRIGVVLLNAVKEQQEQITRQNAQIEQQQKQLQEQQMLIEGLRKLVCSQQPQAGICP